MKNCIFVLLLTLMACSSDPSKQGSSSSTTASRGGTFKKEKPLAVSEVQDFYGDVGSSQSPALQDETLDRMTDVEIGKVKTGNDQLAELAVLCTEKDFNDAFKLSSKMFTRYQKIPGYWNVIGNCHLNQGNNRKALLFYNKAIEVSPGYVPALNNIGVLYSKQGEEQKALIAFERANKQSKFAKTPRYNLARLYLKFGLVEPALPLFQGLLSESPQDIDLLNATASCYFIMSDYQKAISFYDQIPKKFWESPEIGLNIAITLKKLGKTQEAGQVYSDVRSPKSKALQDYHDKVGSQLGTN